MAATTTRDLQMVMSLQDKVSAKLGGIDSKMAGFGSRIKQIGGILAGYFSINAFRGMISTQLQTLDATAKLSDELGISTEALLGFQHAAELTGTSNETLAKGLQRLVRRLGEAKAGLGEGRKGLEALGLDATKMAEMSADEALMVIADRIAGIGTASERAAAAYALFGRQGQELMNFFMGGRGYLEAMRKEVDALGASFSRTDLRKIEEANDAMARMQKSLSGIKGSITIALAPTLTSLANKLQTFKDDFVDTWAIIGGAAALGVVKPYNVIEHLLTQQIPAVLGYLKDHFRQVFDELGANVSAFFRNLWENIRNGWDYAQQELEYRSKRLYFEKTKEFAGHEDVRREEIARLDREHKDAAAAREFQWKNLSEGMTNVWRNIEIPERSKGVWEKALEDTIDEATRRIIGRKAVGTGTPPPTPEAVGTPIADVKTKAAKAAKDAGLVEQRLRTSVTGFDEAAPIVRLGDEARSQTRLQQRMVAGIERLVDQLGRHGLPEQRIPYAAGTAGGRTLVRVAG